MYDDNDDNDRDDDNDRNDDNDDNDRDDDKDDNERDDDDNDKNDNTNTLLAPLHRFKRYILLLLILL